MADVSRTDLSRPPERTGGAGESRIEQLLLAGLDHYFAGEYERAISVWSRVLFFDRGHARARAYIERARSAIAERQRESEELMHRGVDAFDRGEADRARELLTNALERGGPHDVAFAFLDRLDRLQPAAAPAVPPPDAAPDAVVARRRPSLPVRLPRQRLWVFPILLLAVLGGGWYLATSLDVGGSSLLVPGSGQQGTRPAGLDAVSDPLPVPSPGEIALARAHTLVETGHLKEALRVLEAVDTGDPLRAEVESLTADVQRALLAGVRSPVAGVTTGPGK